MTPAPTGTRSGRVGVGVIGAGVISEQYLSNLTAFPDLDVRFVADLDVARAAARAEQFGVPASGTVPELLARDDVELVVNLTIPAAHVEVGLAILDAGKHVWSEKPFALDRDGAAALLTAARDRGLRVGSAPDTFLGAGLQSAQRLVDDGAIGTPLSALAVLQVPGPESWHPSPEFLFDIGGGPLLDMGPYYVTALVQLLGPVTRVAAASSQARSERTIGSGPRAGTRFPVRVPTQHSALLHFAGGASAQLVLSFESFRSRVGLLEVSGSEGTIAAPDPNRFDGSTTLWDAAGEEREVPAVGSPHTRGIGVLELARAVRAGAPARADGALAEHVLDVLLSIAEAAEHERTVEVASTVSRPAPVAADWDPRAATLAADPQSRG